MKNLWGERFAGAAFAVLAIVMGFLALDFPAGGGQFPLFLSVCTILVASTMLAATFVRPRQFSRRLQPDLSWENWKPVIVLVATVIYIVAVFKAGYFVSTLAYLLTAPLIAGIRQPLTVAGAAAACLAFIYALFHVALGTQTPGNALF